MVLVAIGALAYFKVLTLEKFLPNSCNQMRYDNEVFVKGQWHCFNDSMAQQNIIVADVFYKNFTRVEEWN